MKVTFFPFFALFFSVFWMAGCKNDEQSIPLIEMSAARIVNESATGNVLALFDEQKDPLKEGKASIKTFWIPQRETAFYPLLATIDLKGAYYIDKIWVYKKWQTELKIQKGIPFHWGDSLHPTEENEGWEIYPVKDTMRYLRLTVASGEGPGEILFYGNKIKEDQKDIASKKNNKKQHKKQAKKDTQKELRKAVSMDQIMGVNSFVDDPMEKVTWATAVREYHNWLWIEGNQWQFNNEDPEYKGYPKNENKFQPSYSGIWHFDDYYKSLKGENMMVSPVLQGSVAWITSAAGDKPVTDKENPEKPASYIEHADHLYQMAARYGCKKVNKKYLKLAADQPVKSGLCYLKYYENWNEPDNWWLGRKAYFTPYELAAMTSADYDGHQKELGKTIGIKNADPKAKLVLAGLASLNIDYIEAIRFWCEFKRDGALPFDVINFHYYGNIDMHHNKYAISPEQDSLKEKIEKIVKYRNEIMPEKEVWISEFGFDTHPHSTQAVPRRQKEDREEVQAQWIVRCFLAFAAAGVDRSMLYMLRDANSKSNIRFSTSGITKDPASNWKVKKSYYYVHTLRKALDNMIFKKEQKWKDVWVYQFEEKKNKKKAYVIWCPTSKGKIVNNFKIEIPSKKGEYQLISFKNGSMEGDQKKIKTHHPTLSLMVSENPIIIIPDGK